jgi:uncharacterized protein YxeA
MKKITLIFSVIFVSLIAVIFYLYNFFQENPKPFVHESTGVYLPGATDTFTETK